MQFKTIVLVLFVAVSIGGCKKETKVEVKEATTATKETKEVKATTAAPAGDKAAELVQKRDDMGKGLLKALQSGMPNCDKAAEAATAFIDKKENVDLVTEIKAFDKAKLKEAQKAFMTKNPKGARELGMALMGIMVKCKDSEKFKALGNKLKSLNK